MEKELINDLSCIVCKNERLIEQDNFLICEACQRHYPIIQGRPILTAAAAEKNNDAVKPLIEAASALQNRHLVPQWEHDPSFDDLENYYFNKLFPHFNRRDPHWSFLGRKVSEMVKSVPKGAKVLDIGAGECKYGALFQHCKYVGTDLVYSSDRHDFSRIDLLSDASALPFCEETFDVALNLVVMEHVPDPDLTVREMARVLKVGGLAYALIPLVRPEHLPPFDFHRFTRYGIERIFEKNGLQIEGIEGSNGALWTAAYYLNLIAQTTPLTRFGRRNLRGVLLNRFWRFALSPLMAYARWSNHNYGSEFPIYYWVRASKK